MNQAASTDARIRHSNSERRYLGSGQRFWAMIVGRPSRRAVRGPHARPRAVPPAGRRSRSAGSNVFHATLLGGKLGPSRLPPLLLSILSSGAEDVPYTLVTCARCPGRWWRGTWLVLGATCPRLPPTNSGEPETDSPTLDAGVWPVVVELWLVVVGAVWWSVLQTLYSPVRIRTPPPSPSRVRTVRPLPASLPEDASVWPRR